MFHRCTFANAFAISARNNANERSTPSRRPIRTWSAPAMPRSGRASRESARRRRFMRFRMTALPTFLLTVNPTRIVGSSSRRSRASKTNPGIGARLPAFAARKSARRVSVTRSRTFPSCKSRGVWSTPCLLRPTAWRGPVHGDCGSRRDRPLSPSGRETRGDVRGRGCSAEKCASLVMPYRNANRKKAARTRTTTYPVSI